MANEPRNSCVNNKLLCQSPIWLFETALARDQAREGVSCVNFKGKVWSFTHAYARIIISVHWRPSTNQCSCQSVFGARVCYKEASAWLFDIGKTKLCSSRPLSALEQGRTIPWKILKFRILPTILSVRWCSVLTPIIWLHLHGITT